jgi:hypothetical protein
VDIALRRASDAARALEPCDGDAAAAGIRADLVGTSAAVVFVEPAEDTFPSVALPPLLMARRLAITRSRVLCVVAVCAIVNPVESTFHPVIHA